MIWLISIEAGTFGRSDAAPENVVWQPDQPVKDDDTVCLAAEEDPCRSPFYDIAVSRQILVPQVQNPGPLIMVHELTQPAKARKSPR